MISRQRRWGLVLCVAMLALIASAQNAFSQFGRRPGGAGGGLIGLAAHPAVQKELGLDEAAALKVTDVAGDFGEEMRDEVNKAGIGFEAFQELQELDEDKRAEKLRELRAKTIALGRKLEAKYILRLKELLTKEQFIRLQQLRWQAGGSQSLEDADLAKALNLSKEQQEKIANLNKFYAEKQSALFSAGFASDGGNREELMTKSQELAKERDAKALELLKDDQKKKYAELKGKPYDITLLQQ